MPRPFIRPARGKGKSIRINLDAREIRRFLKICKTSGSAPAVLARQAVVEFMEKAEASKRAQLI